MRSLENFKDLHLGMAGLVCGCGESGVDLGFDSDLVTVGISDIGRSFTPKYLLVCNYESQYEAERFRYISSSVSDYIFTSLRYFELKHDRIVHVDCNKFSGVDLDRIDSLNYSSTSAYMALCLAIHMGLNPIGVLGVDFTDNILDGVRHPHPLGHQVAQMNNEFDGLAQSAIRRGFKIYNLSNTSRITSFEYLSWLEFRKLYAAT